MSQFRILDQNFCFDEVTQFFATSEDTSFPKENMSHPFRAKAWRSYGFFRISSTKYVDFKDFSGGSELSASIPPGEYTVTELEELIAARMFIAGGAGPYTVTHSRTTGKWTIASGHVALELLPLTGSHSANGLLATLGFDTSVDYTGAVTYTGAQIALHTEERFVIDIANPEEVDSFAMIFDPDNGHGFTNSATIHLMASASNYWYGTPEVDVTLSIDDTYDRITHFFSSAQNYRYWCVKIVDPQNPNLYVEIPKIVLAKATQLGQSPERGFTSVLVDQTEQQANAYGNVFSDVNPTRKKYRFSYQFLTEEDLETLEQIYMRNGGVRPIAVALDPLAELFDKDRFFCYGRLGKEASASHVNYDLFNTEFVLEEAL